MRHVLRRRHLKVVIVTLKTGETFRGVLWQHDSEALVLRNTESLRGNEAAGVAVDGELILQRADVAFIQRP